MSAPTSRISLNRRTLLRAGAGMAGILATGRAPAFAQTQPKKLVFAHINAVPESAAVAFDWMAKEVTARSKGALDMQFFGKTLIPQELEIMNAVKSGSIAMGSPAGAAATVFPEMGALLVPYLVKDYASAYAMLNGTDRRQARARRSRTTTSSRCSAISITASAISGPRRSRSSSRRTCAA